MESMISSEELRVRCRANVAHISQSRPYSGIGVQVNIDEIVCIVPSSLESGR